MLKKARTAKKINQEIMKEAGFTKSQMNKIRRRQAITGKLEGMQGRRRLRKKILEILSA